MPISAKGGEPTIERVASLILTLRSDGCQNTACFYALVRRSARQIKDSWPSSKGMHLARLNRQVTFEEVCDEFTISNDHKISPWAALCIHANGQALSFQEGCQMPGVRSARGNSR